MRGIRGGPGWRWSRAAVPAGTLALGTTTAANLFLKLRNRRGLWSIIWAIALVLAAIVVIWVAYVFNLLTVGVTY